jgi:hypothetical protein
MGVISFSRPQEGIDYYRQVIDLIGVISDIVKNPGSAGNEIDKLSKALIASQEISEAKKQQARDAEEIIAQAREAQEDLVQATAEHNAKIAADKMDYDNREKFLQARIDGHVVDKALSQKANEKAAQEAALKLAQAQKTLDDAKTHSANAQVLDASTAQKLKIYEASVITLEQEKAVHEQNKMAAIEELAIKTQKLADATSAFETRKKKFEDALKG